MLKAHRVTRDNFNSIQSLYEAFSAVSKTDYHWDHDPITFDELRKAFSTGMLGAYWIEDTGLQQQIALMLYTREDHRAIEINLIYIVQGESHTDVYRKGILDCMMRAFIKDMQADPQLLETFDVVSFPLLGEQELLVRSILWYGFRASGQAIVKFDIMDPISLAILNKQNVPTLPEGYHLTTWQPQYAVGVAEAIFQSFEHSTDSYWDPRFRTEMGARKVVSMLTYGLMGTLIPECTTVLLKGEMPVGFCFLVQDSMTEGNIPLIGVIPSEGKKQFGNLLLKHTVTTAIQNILDGKIGMLRISATHDTDNIAAIKMYRRMGFREDYNYPHVYLTNEKLRSYQFGKWC